MCGIIGYVGLDDAKKELLKGLQALEYRAMTVQVLLTASQTE